jgi:hypothetical protein
MKRCRGVVLLLLTVPALWACVFAGQARAATGSITGTVTDSVTHAGVADIQVYASLGGQGGPPTGDVATSADGTYVMTGLAPGDYMVWFMDQDGATNGDYADEWYDDNVSQDFAEPVSVADGATVTHVDAALSGCGTIYGWVTGDGARLLNACVQAYCWVPARQQWESYPLEFQDVDPTSGEYTIERVRAGQWAVHFGDHGSAAGTYAGEFYPDAHFVWDAQTVLVTPGSSLFVKGDLDLGGTLSGHVFDSTGTPVEGGTVALYDWDPDKQQWSWAGIETPTWADGSYAIAGLDTWTYQLQFIPPEASALASEYWFNSSGPDGAADLTWSIGQVREDYDAWLGTQDAVAPVTSLTGAPASGWSRWPLALTLQAGDAGSGVELTQYKLDGGTWTAGTTVGVPAPATHTNDGLHVVEYRSSDFRGNWEPARTSQVHIDTQGPTTVAVARVSARKGTRTRFRFSVGDVSPTVKVTIKVYRGAKLVKSLGVGTRATGRALDYRWKCSVGRGRYAWKVLATDKAGNPQVKIGSKPLVVN